MRKMFLNYVLESCHLQFICSNVKKNRLSFPIFHRVLVLDQGEIKEFDSPETLMANKESMFASMAKDAGIL